NEETIDNLIKTYCYILEQLSQLEVNSQQCIKDLTYLTTQDYQKIIIQWNETDKHKRYILDKNLIPLPLGAIGELYIDVDGLATGYLNKSELNVERVIDNPFQSETERKSGLNRRLYRTGELARYLPDKNIEYLGRTDLRVKLHGFRIDLGEIESVLTTYPGVSQAVVLAKEFNLKFGQAENILLVGQKSDKCLIGYYAAENELEEGKLLEYLAAKIPQYMVPARIIYLKSPPLALNGNLDRDVLQHIEVTIGDRGKYTAPRTVVEQEMCQVYAEVLGLRPEQIGIYDDFFKLGGDSISSIRLIGKLRQRLDLNISIKDVFNYRSVHGLYDNFILKSIPEGVSYQIDLNETDILTGSTNLLPIQKWFFNNISWGLIKNYNHWNQSFLVKVESLDVDVLRLSLKKLIEYHDGLRVIFSSPANDISTLRLKKQNEEYCLFNPYQEMPVGYYDNVDDNHPITLNVFDLKNLNCLDGVEITYKLGQVFTQWQSNFNLTDGSPLYSFGYVTGYPDGSSRLYCAFHHLIIDTVSWRILVDDLSIIYTKLLKVLKIKGSTWLTGGAVRSDVYELANSFANIDVYSLLGKKGASYRQWTKAIAIYGDTHNEEHAFWENLLTEIKHSSFSLGDFVEEKNVYNLTDFDLNCELTKNLLTTANQAYKTQINDLLLSAFSLALTELTGSMVSYITLEGHGREEIGYPIDITRTSGWFTTMYPVRLQCNTNDLQNTIISIKEALRAIPNKGIGYGAVYGYTQDLPKISFNYLGQFDKIDNSMQWSIVNEFSGNSISDENIDANILSLNGLVVNGNLSFKLSGRLGRVKLNRLSESFKTNLIRVINHTCGLTRQYLTASDINNVISNDYLSDIQKIREINNVYYANTLQQGFIYHALSQEHKDYAYKIQLCFCYKSQLNVEFLKRAWEAAQAKYPALRLRFAWQQQLVQIVDKNAQLDWRYFNLVGQDYESQQYRINKIAVEDRYEPYNLSEGNLFRIYLIQQSEFEYYCILSSHHAIIDGWSNTVLLNFVHDTYLNLIDGRQLIVVEDVAYLKSQHYLQQSIEGVSIFWADYVNRIEKYPDLSSLLKLNKRNIKLAEYRHILEFHQEQLTISGLKYNALKDFTWRHGLTMNVILQYAWHKVLSVYGNTLTTISGIIVSGRDLPINGIEDSVGLFIKTLPLIIIHEPHQAILQMLNTVQAEISNINAHKNVNLAQLQYQGQRIFDSLFIFENYPIKNSFDKLNIEFKEAIEKLDYPLVLMAYEQNNKVTIKIKYAAELFEKSMIQRILVVMQVIFDQTLGTLNDVNSCQLDESISNLRLITDEDYQKLVINWNETDEDYELNKTIHG
ncbi:MAG: hypothetical protein QG673_1897, partial [Pseudomonadota bacterium]|nr:hypothetical protein [Pseudomonadota bacterium]